MGNVSSVLFPPYSALSENRLDQTELQFYIDLASAQLKSKILHVSDEFFGDAANLLKLEECKTRKNIDGERDGWQTQRHIDSASVTIQLGIHGHVRGFDIDTTSFNDASPISVTVEAGRSIQWQEQTQWDIVLPNVEIQSNRHNLFTINNNHNTYSQIRVTMPSGGGIARLRCYGVPQPAFSILQRDSKQSLNLASILLGARIISCTDESYDIKPNVLLEDGRSPEDGWEAPHSRDFERNDSLVIKLAARARLETIQVSTEGFIGNAPEYISIKGCLSGWNDPEAQWEEVPWVEILPKQSIQANKVNEYKISSDQEISHIKFTMYPDGGIQNISVFGTPAIDGTASATTAIETVGRAVPEENVSISKSTSPEQSQVPVVPEEPPTTGRKRGRGARRTVIKETTTIEQDVIRERRSKRSKK